MNKVNLNFLSLDNIENENKKNIDLELYEKKLLKNETKKVFYAFNEYRNLKNNLEVNNVFCKDFEKNKNLLLDKNNNIIIIDAYFPKTFKMSTMGFNLNENQLLERYLF
jgi:hypothetical protein